MPIFVSLLLAVLLASSVARAQIMLPGALQAQPGGSNGSPGSAGSAPKMPKLAGLKPPALQSILGRDLAQNGSNGTISFRSAGDGAIEIVKLTLAGESMSRPGEPCMAGVTAVESIKTSFDGRPNGLLRYAVAFPACPFTFDVLDGAVLVSPGSQPCTFKEVQCRADPSGLWGPRGDAIGPDQAKQIERERARAESDLRSYFRALLPAAAKDREAEKKIIAEQAGFSSAREMTCRTYQKEDVHGFCALRLTQARAFALQAAYYERAKAKVSAGPAARARE